MALGTVAAGAFGLGKELGLDLNLGGVLDSIGGFLGIGNNRDEKRKARDKVRNALWDAGMSRTILSKQHSDHYKAVQKLGQWVQENGKPAIEFLNEEKRHVKGVGGSIPLSEVTRGFQGWLEDKKREQRQKEQSNNQGGGQSQAGGISWPIIGVVLAAVYMILNLLNQ